MGSAPVRFRGIASSLLAVMRNTGMAFGIAVAGAVVYNLAPFTTRGNAGPFHGVRLDTFINGLHWAYLTGALFSLLSATAVLMARAEKCIPGTKTEINGKHILLFDITGFIESKCLSSRNRHNKRMLSQFTGHHPATFGIDSQLFAHDGPGERNLML